MEYVGEWGKHPCIQCEFGLPEAACPELSNDPPTVRLNPPKSLPRWSHFWFSNNYSFACHTIRSPTVNSWLNNDDPVEGNGRCYLLQQVVSGLDLVSGFVADGPGQQEFLP